MSDSGDYPQRPKLFALKFVRLLVNTNAAQTIGTDGFAMLTIIVLQEDALYYRGPVTFWNEQLMWVLGIGGRDRLNNIRKKLTEAEWLHYEPGKKGIAGKYWVTVPPQLQGLPDAGANELPPECHPETGRNNGQVKEVSGNESGQKGRHIQDGKADTKPTQTGRHSSLCPEPSPNPIPKEERDGILSAFAQRFIERGDAIDADYTIEPSKRIEE
jgi:hypothetical protein